MTITKMTITKMTIIKTTITKMTITKITITKNDSNNDNNHNDSVPILQTGSFLKKKKDGSFLATSSQKLGRHALHRVHSV